MEQRISAKSSTIARRHVVIVNALFCQARNSKGVGAGAGEVVGMALEPFATSIQHRLTALFLFAYFCFFCITNRFPGSYPVDFEPSHMQQLASEEYFVTEKFASVRCMLLSTNTPKGPACFLV